MQPEQQKTCSKCGMLMVLKPAGVSKSKLDQYGRPKVYPAFWSCTSGQKGHTENFELNSMLNPMPNYPPQPNNSYPQENNVVNVPYNPPVQRPLAQDPQMTKALIEEKNKQLRIARESAISSICKVMKPQDDLVTATAQIIEAADILTNYVYQGKDNQETLTDEEVDGMPF